MLAALQKGATRPGRGHNMPPPRRRAVAGGAQFDFTDLQVESPVLADAYGLADPADLNAYDYDVERTRAPMMLIHGCRPST